MFMWNRNIFVFKYCYMKLIVRIVCCGWVDEMKLIVLEMYRIIYFVFYYKGIIDMEV